MLVFSLKYYSDNSKPARYYDYELDLNTNTLKDIAKWLTDKVSNSTGSNSS